MKKLSQILLFVLTLSGLSFAQNSKPSPTPPPVVDDTDVVKITTTLIQVDVTVTDKNGKIVSGLKPGDFEIFENGKKQEITNFSFIQTATNIVPSQKVADSQPKGAAGIPLPPVRLRPEQVRRTIALVVDDLGLSFESMPHVRTALKRFVDEQMQSNDLVAIIRSGSGSGALQQFTSDKNQLYAAIERVRWNALGRGGISAFAPIEQTPLEQLKSAGGDVSDEDLQAERERNQESANFRNESFSVGTLGAINFVTSGMKEFPGRKSVILFSEGFSICSRTDSTFDCDALRARLKRLIEACNRAAVTIYSIDPRGLQTLMPTAQDDLGGLSPQQVAQRMSDRRDQLLDTQDGLKFLSSETGGRAFLNNNDTSGSVVRALEDQKGYYLIAYQPDEETFDPKKSKFNQLAVKVKGKDLFVRFRSGFFGVADSAVANTSTAKLTPVQQIQKALLSPFSTNDVNVKLNTLFGWDPTTGSYLNSFLHIDAKGLQFTDTPEGKKAATIQILSVSFGDSGIPVDQISRSYTLTVNEEGYKQLISDGFVYRFTFPVKTPGAYQMRVAVRDPASEKTGSANLFIEVPNLKKDRLTLSGIVLENFTEEQWKKAMQQSSGGAKTENESSQPDPWLDTSLRKYKRGTILRYFTEIYNAKFAAGQVPQVTARIRVFREGVLVLDGKAMPIDLRGHAVGKKPFYSGAITIGRQMEPGEYVLQMIVTDELAKQKYKIATQWVQFEVVD